MLVAPAASRATKKAHELVTTGLTETIRLSLHDGFTVSFALSPASMTF
ncbi:hypothetical protein [Bradyrhizobium sp. NP1]|nr:hypothetical protein [Bradyrhizobium sp. NP1]WJR77545.1 hypothetical protein QOU61_33325 [Bradyrhizobium sp. NP1]